MPDPKDVCRPKPHEIRSASDSDCESLLESLSLPEEDEESESTTWIGGGLVEWPEIRSHVAGNV